MSGYEGVVDSSLRPLLIILQPDSYLSLREPCPCFGPYPSSSVISSSPKKSSTSAYLPPSTIYYALSRRTRAERLKPAHHTHFLPHCFHSSLSSSQILNTSPSPPQPTPVTTFTLTPNRHGSQICKESGGCLQGLLLPSSSSLSLSLLLLRL
jgi:hypothetical protein